MNWATLDVDGEMGLDSLTCSTCGHPESDLVWFPTKWDTPDGALLRLCMNIKDPWPDVSICGKCHVEIIEIFRERRKT